MIERNNSSPNKRKEKNKENTLRVKLQDKEAFEEDKPEHFARIRDGLHEVKKLKDLAETLYSQMNFKVIFKF